MKQTTAKNYIVKSELLEEEYREEGYAMLFGEFSVLTEGASKGKESLILVDQDSGEQYGEILGEPGAFVPAKKFKAVSVYGSRGEYVVEWIEHYEHADAKSVADEVNKYSLAAAKETASDMSDSFAAKLLEDYDIVREENGVWWVSAGEETQILILPEDHRWFSKVEAIEDISASDDDFAAWTKFVGDMW